MFDRRRIEGEQNHSADHKPRALGMAWDKIPRELRESRQHLQRRTELRAELIGSERPVTFYQRPTMPSDERVPLSRKHAAPQPCLDTD